MKAHQFFCIVAFSVLMACQAGCFADTRSEAVRVLSKMEAHQYFEDRSLLKLAEAIEHSDSELMVKLIRSGADVNGVGHDGIRPIFWAIAKRSPKGFKVLLENGANPNVTAKSPISGSRPLSVMELAAIEEGSEYLALALANKGDANFSLGYGRRTIIYEAIIHERIDNVRLLVEGGASLSVQDSAGESPVMTAALVNAYNIVYLLLEKGADPTLKDKWGFDLVGEMKKFGTRGIAPESEQFRWYQKVSDLLKSKGLW